MKFQKKLSTDQHTVLLTDSFTFSREIEYSKRCIVHFLNKYKKFIRKLDVLIW